MYYTVLYPFTVLTNVLTSLSMHDYSYSTVAFIVCMPLPSFDIFDGFRSTTHPPLPQDLM